MFFIFNDEKYICIASFGKLGKLQQGKSAERYL